jgi:hypothetical protein
MYPRSQLQISHVHAGRLRSGAVENEADDVGVKGAVDGKSKNGQRALRAKRLPMCPRMRARLLRSLRSLSSLKSRPVLSKRVMVKM